MCAIVSFMLLHNYFINEKIRYTTWAKKHKIAPPVISRYLRGMFNLSPQNALRIHRATNGAVSINELLYPNGELDSIQPETKDS